MSTFQTQQQLPQPQSQPQQQQQQPVVVYPNPVTKQPVPDSSHHSNGSFGTVFIVLAIIAVVSAIACLLGRLCNRRVVHNQKPKVQSSHKPSRSHKGRSDHHQVEFGNNGRNNFRARDHGDVEFGNNPNNINPRSKEGGGGGGGGGDIEFGFDNKRPVLTGNGVKPNGNREGRGHVEFENINGAVRHHGDHHDGGPPRANHE